MYFCQPLKFSWGNIMESSITSFLPMSLSKQLITLRKDKGLTQQQMADTVGIHVNSIKKYETTQVQPSLDVLKKIAKTLHISTDSLLFEAHERGPNDELVLQFEAVSQLPQEEQEIIKEVLDSLIIKYQTRRWDTSRQTAK